MATNDKEQIYIGDTIPLEFECLEPVAESENAYTFTQTKVFPTDAYVKVWDVNNQAYLEIGSGVDPTEDAAMIASNIITYVVDGAHTQAAGDLKVFTTVTFPDGQVVTEVRLYRVREKQ